MKKKVRVFTLPAEEDELNSIFADDEKIVVDRVITACPKEGIILYLIEYEEV